MTEKDWAKYFDDFLEDEEAEEFYNLMQAYRHHPIHDPSGVLEAYAKVKAFFGKQIDLIR